MQIIKGKTTWIDIFKPNNGDIEALKKHYDFHPVILNELLQPSTRGRVEHYKTYLFIVYHIPVYDPKTRTSRRAEIDILVTKNSLILIRYEQLEQLDAFVSEVGRNQQLQKELLSGESYLALYRVLEEITNFSLRQLHHIEEQVRYIGAEIFSGRENELLKNISYIKRNILDYRLIVKPHEIMFHSLREIGTEFWGDKSRVYLADLIGDNLKVTQSLENYFEIIESLENTNGQLLEARSGEIMKAFTIGAFLFSIPFLFIFLLDIPYIGDVILATPLRFWITFCLMLACVMILIWTFKKKRML
ncbi:MAG: CorA family divalent cation transporter [bacterium]|nr:CorA family divalent cation transporter [bacterium]